MVNISFDPDAGTLYWYFTELEAGSTAGEAECDGTLLLDADGQVIGLELELDDSIKRAELALALAHPQVRFDRAAALLVVHMFDEEPAEVQPLHEVVLLDFDDRERLQGCEVLAAPEFGLAGRLARLAAFRVSLDDDRPPPDLALDEQADADELAELDALDEQADADELAELDALDGQADADELAELDALDEQADADELAELDALDEQADAFDDPPAPVVTPPVPAPPPSAMPPGFRSGFVALVGRPNVGKSTLLNALLGQKVAIVSPKPQTTRMPLRGILNRPDAQIVFVDTPGIHDPRTKLGSFMVEQARRSIPDADVVCFVVDIASPPNRTEQRIATLVARSRARRLLVLNKVDQRTPAGQANLVAYRALGPWDMEVAVSALRSQGLTTLLHELVQRLPPGPPLYPDDQVTDQSEREHAAELVREQVLRFTEQEVPHGVAVEVEEWEDKPNAVYIRMTIYVEKESQKGILIGANGTMLKRIGSGARPAIEAISGKPAYLDLWVKVRLNWRDDPSSLRWLGYRGDG
jgi:GTP-binding protein Era